MMQAVCQHWQSVEVCGISSAGIGRYDTTVIARRSLVGLAPDTIVRGHDPPGFRYDTGVKARYSAGTQG
jgi:hypothetical protein